MNIFDYKVGCTYLPRIMSNAKREYKINHAFEYAELSQKKNPTEKQQKRLQYLSNLRDGREPNNLPKSAQEQLRKWVIQELYGKRYRITSEEAVSSLIKGTQTEKIAFDTINERFGGGFYRVKARLSNNYITGYLDGADAETVDEATKIIEVKTCEDLNDFVAAVTNPLSNSIYWQCQGYMALTGKQVVDVIHVLTPHTDDTIEQQRMLLFERFCPNGEFTEEFDKNFNIALTHMTYSDIPLREKVVVRSVERNESDIELINKRVQHCWAYMLKFEAEYTSIFQ